MQIKYLISPESRKKLIELKRELDEKEYYEFFSE